MVAEENKIIVRRMIEEVWNAHDHGAIDDFVARDYFNHAAVSEHRRGIEGPAHPEVAGGRFPGLPLRHRGHHRGWGHSGDPGKSSGTHDGEFMGHPPTGRRFSVDQVH